jgi:hypothetical protein
VLQERTKIEVEFVDTCFIVMKRQGSVTELSEDMIYHQFTVFQRVILEKLKQRGGTQNVCLYVVPFSARRNDVMVIKKLFTTGYEGVILLFCE